jgi:WD40 repeat protein
LNPIEKEFLDASIALESSERDATRRRTRNARLLAAALGVLLVASLIAGTAALQRSREAERQGRLAFSRELAAKADSLVDSRLDTAALLAVEAFHVAPTTEARTSLLNLSNRPEYAVTLPGSEGSHLLQFSPDGHILASAHRDNAVKLWDMDRHVLAITLTVQGEPTNNMKFSPNGQTLAVALGAHNPVIGLYDSSTDFNYHAESVTLWDVVHHAQVATLTNLPGHVTNMDFTPNGDTLALGTGHVTVDQFRDDPNAFFPTPGNTIDVGGAVDLWDVARRTRVGTLPGIQARKDSDHPDWSDPIEQVTFSPDGRILATMNHYNTHVITLWDVARRAPVATLKAEIKKEDSVLAVGFTRGGRLVSISGNGDTLYNLTGTTTTVWDVARRVPVATISQDETSVGGTVSSDGRTLTSLGIKGNVVVWDLASHRATMRLSAPNGFSSVPGMHISDDAGMVAFVRSANGTDTIVLWDLNAARVAVRICEKIGHSLTRQEWDQYVPNQPYRNTCSSR